MLSLGHLSPSIVDPSHLRDYLLKIRAKLPHHLRLLADPMFELWRYYNTLGCITLVENCKLLILVSVSLLDAGSVFEVFEVINLPIPYPNAKQDLRIVA